MATAFRWQIEGKLAGMGFPFGWDDEILHKRGIDSLITLTENVIPHNWAADFHILHLPTKDTPEGPSIKDSQKAIEFIDSRLKQGGAVAVHCNAGINRTTYVLAYYLVAHGMDPEDALKEVEKHPPYSSDITSVMKYNVRHFKEYLESSS